AIAQLSPKAIVCCGSGPHQGRDGLHRRAARSSSHGQRVKYAKIVKVYNGVDIVKKEDTGPSSRCVGALFRGNWRVIDNSKASSPSLLTRIWNSRCDKPSFPNFHPIRQPRLPVWRFGRVRTGKHQGRVGLIVATFTGGSIEVFDGDKPKPEQTEFPDHVFKVRAADVDLPHLTSAIWLTIEHAGISSYTATSHVAPLNPHTDEAAEEKAAAKPKRQMQPPLLCRQLSQLEAKAERTKKKTLIARSPLRRHSRPGSRERLAQGFQGTIIGDHDNAARVRRLAKSAERGGLWHDEDQDGIVSPSERNGSFDGDVTVDKCLHQYTSLPLTKARFLPRDVLMGHVAPRQKGYLQGLLPAPKTPPPPRTPSPPPSSEPLWAAIPETPLAGEDNGEWMCMPGLNGKHLMSKSSKLEGRFGHILATAAIDFGAKKVEVCGVGKSGTKHAVHVQCIKPRRKNDSGRLITEVAEHVVVIGPDMAGGTTLMGCYGLTQPDIPHYYEAGIVCVVVECLDGSFDPNFFKASSLCLAKNVALTYQNQVFAATTFPP
ncbi:hypothetical protein B0H13DRAFT_1936646, partial [Mycena leptocephala]